MSYLELRADQEEAMAACIVCCSELKESGGQVVQVCRTTDNIGRVKS